MCSLVKSPELFLGISDIFIFYHFFLHGLRSFIRLSIRRDLSNTANMLELDGSKFSNVHIVRRGRGCAEDRKLLVFKRIYMETIVLYRIHKSVLYVNWKGGYQEFPSFWISKMKLFLKSSQMVVIWLVKNLGVLVVSFEGCDQWFLRFFLYSLSPY